MKRLLVVLSLALCASSIFAGRATITGNASITDKPDYVEISVSVDSKCFATLDALNSAHDGYVAELQNRFSGYFDTTNDFNKVSVNAGWASPYSHVIYHRDGTDNEKVCQNTYQKHTSITIKSSDLAGFSELLAWIYGDVSEVFTNASGDERTPSTLTTISSPSSKICETTRTAWRNKALKSAREDAQEQFKAEFCGAGINLDQVCITSSAQPGATKYHESYAKSAAFRGGADASVTYTVEDISVEASREYVFEYPDCRPFGCSSN